MIPPDTVGVSDDESSISQQPDGPDRFSDGYITYNISTYSKAELQKLKRHLESELEQVRGIISWSELREIRPYAGSTIYASGSDGACEFPSAVHSGEGQFHHAASRLAAANPAAKKALATMMSKCKEIVAKLMKQKGDLWFTGPFDKKSINMPDYHPIDLSTVRMHLNQGFYVDPMEFAAELKQTFNNALLSNPKCHMMHDSPLAVNFRCIFDKEFGRAYQEYEKQLEVIAREDEHQRMASWSWVPLPKNPPRAHPVQELSPLRPDPVPQISPLHQVVAPDEVPDRTSEPDPAPLQQQKPVMGRMQKARNLEKRAMSIEEKEQLSEGLQSLPQEKMEQVLQIVKRSNELVQDEDEIKLDFEAMDTEMLWELDRFVRNCRKIEGKISRYEVMTATDMGSAPEDRDQQNSGKAPNAANVATPAANRMKRGVADDEEVVDIGDNEMPAWNYPSVEIEKDNANLGSDSSSSSSSGDSDSSLSDSDGEDEAQSPAVGSRSSP